VQDQTQKYFKETSWDDGAQPVLVPASCCVLRQGSNVSALQRARRPPNPGPCQSARRLPLNCCGVVWAQGPRGGDGSAPLLPGPHQEPTTSPHQKDIVSSPRLHTTRSLTGSRGRKEQHSDRRAERRRWCCQPVGGCCRGRCAACAMRHAQRSSDVPQQRCTKLDDRQITQTQNTQELPPQTGCKVIPRPCRHKMCGVATDVRGTGLPTSQLLLPYRMACQCRQVCVCVCVHVHPSPRFDPPQNTAHSGPLLCCSSRRQRPPPSGSQGGVDSSLRRCTAARLQPAGGSCTPPGGRNAGAGAVHPPPPVLCCAGPESHPLADPCHPRSHQGAAVGAAPSSSHLRRASAPKNKTPSQLQPCATMHPPPGASAAAGPPVVGSPSRLPRKTAPPAHKAAAGAAARAPPPPTRQAILNTESAG